MTLHHAPRTFSLKDARSSNDALVYYGHLIGQAEAQLGEDADRYASFALAWIAGDMASRGDKVHSVDFAGLSQGDKLIGDWSISLRVGKGRRQPIELYRRQFLTQDGKKIVDLCAPLIDEGDTDKLDAFCVLHLAMHCSAAYTAKAQYVLYDCEGNALRVELRQNQNWTDRLKTAGMSIKDKLSPSSFINR